MCLCTSYARGQGIRINSHKSFNLKGMGVMILITDVMQWVIECKSDSRYERLIAIGFGDIDSVQEIALELLEA